MTTSPLHSSPDGLLELLRLKVQGKNPDQFSDVLQPTVELTEFYGAKSVVAVTETGAAGVLPQTQNAAASAFPRRLLALSGRVVLGAAVGTNISMQLAVVVQGQAVHVGSFAAATFAGGIFAVAAQLPRPLVLPPQHSYSVAVQGDAAGADHVVSIRYLYQRLDGLP